MSKCCYNKLHVVALGLALGILWGLSILITGLIATAGGFSVDFISETGSVYVGYRATVLGSFIGALWGFLHLFVTGVLIAALYNLFVCCCHKKCPSCKCTASDTETTKNM